MTFKDLEEINKGLATVDIKGKDYVQVNTRVLAFRRLFPMGCISTEIVSLEDGIVVMRATVSDENGKILGTGLAYEKETSSYINKTSYIENCETSAVGRALAMLGIGTDASMCSAEELVNAIKNQSNDAMNLHISTTKASALIKLLENNAEPLKAKNITAETICKKYKVQTFTELTESQYTDLMSYIRKVVD